MRHRPLRYAAVAALLLALPGCGGGDGGDRADRASSSPTGTPGSSSTEPPTTPSTSPHSPASTAPSEDLRGGTAAQPATPEPATRLLRWQDVAGPVRNTVVTNGPWTLTTIGNGSAWTLAGPTSARSGGRAPEGTRVSDGLLDGDWAVVVLQDKAEQRPSTALVTHLADGKTFRVDGGSDVPTTTGGTWALGEGHRVLATIDRGAYSAATVDLASQKSTLGWCAPKRHGFNDARITPAGTSLLTFDDSRPSCRTVVALDGRRALPFDSVPDCKGWDGLLTDDGAVWSVIPNEHRVEDGHFYARSGDGWFDLGPGTAGSLTYCGGAAYFVRDPQREGDPAMLMRWSSTGGLSVAYRSPGGQAFLSEPRCGGREITVTAMAGQGDEQVSAPAS